MHACSARQGTPREGVNTQRSLPRHESGQRVYTERGGAQPHAARSSRKHNLTQQPDARCVSVVEWRNVSEAGQRLLSAKREGAKGAPKTRGRPQGAGRKKSRRKEVGQAARTPCAHAQPAIKPACGWVAAVPGGGAEGAALARQATSRALALYLSQHPPAQCLASMACTSPSGFFTSVTLRSKASTTTFSASGVRNAGALGPMLQEGRGGEGRGR